jgi:gas vesicle protein
MSTSRFIAGAIFGLVAGLLIAPEKGEDLREDIAEGAAKLRRKVSKIAGKTKAELHDLRAILENEIEGLGDDVRHRILTILEETSDGARNIQHSVVSEMS